MSVPTTVRTHEIDRALWIQEAMLIRLEAFLIEMSDLYLQLCQS
jgi:hypothetical protein